MQRVARRAPGSADMRAALAALYWSRGQQGAAEEQWDVACNQITVGARWAFGMSRSASSSQPGRGPLGLLRCR
jgi:hypothetical protein